MSPAHHATPKLSPPACPGEIKGYLGMSVGFWASSEPNSAVGGCVAGGFGCFKA